MNNRKKIFIILLIVLLGFGVWTQTYSYNEDKATTYLENNAHPKSHHICAWYVMRAMQKGGCPMVILPAWAYRFAMPVYGYNLVHKGKGNDMSGYTPQKGDVVVIEHGQHSFWGHIAMYTGNRWISDFRQYRMSPYRSEPTYRIYRRG